MKILTLSIKQKYFDEILAGTKKIETREIWANNAKKYIYYKCDGITYLANEQLPDNDIEIEILPIKYDALKLLTGAYTGKRPYMLVEVLDAEPIILLDESDNEITYEYKGEQYIAAQIEYQLGKVLETQLYTN